ncbi:hypothetical protein H6764_01440 [Candidatus Nomurabacteria bacterium]|nr:hypothetical protein [Candidatus Nomurabacteria bacterium]
MVILLKKPASEKNIELASKDLEGYLKFVVDIDKRIMTIGGQRHAEGESVLLEN